MGWILWPLKLRLLLNIGKRKQLNKEIKTPTVLNCRECFSYLPIIISNFFFFLTLSFLSVYEVLLSCTYIIETIYNTGENDSFQFIKKANTDRIMEETKEWEIERTKWKRKKRDLRLLVVKQPSKRIYLFVGLRAPQKLANSRACGGKITRKQPWRVVVKWRAKI